eukprot:72185-Pelagomonas_calceolata.AAC.2
MVSMPAVLRSTSTLRITATAVAVAITLVEVTPGFEAGSLGVVHPAEQQPSRLVRTSRPMLPHDISLTPLHPPAFCPSVTHQHWAAPAGVQAPAVPNHHALAIYSPPLIDHVLDSPPRASALLSCPTQQRTAGSGSIKRRLQTPTKPLPCCVHGCLGRRDDAGIGDACAGSAAAAAAGIP